MRTRQIGSCSLPSLIAEWSSPEARQAHNLEVAGAKPVSATEMLMVMTLSPTSEVIRGSGPWALGFNHTRTQANVA